MEFKNQTAVVVGGASGMGAAAATALAKAGSKVAILDINIDAASKLASEIGGAAFAADVTNEQQVAAALEEVNKTLGTPRICVNCAGVATAKRIVGKEGPLPLADFSKVININLIGSFNIMRLCAHAISLLEPVNEDNERGVIINTASIAAYEGQIGQAAYAASKAGVVGLTLPAAREFARFGIRVVTIAPGLIKTPLLMGLPEKVQTELAATVPFPQRLGKPEEFASLVQHIVSNRMINGEVIRLDGALRMQP